MTRVLYKDRYFCHWCGRTMTTAPNGRFVKHNYADRYTNDLGQECWKVRYRERCPGTKQTAGDTRMSTSSHCTCFHFQHVPKHERCDCSLPSPPRVTPPPAPPVEALDCAGLERLRVALGTFEMTPAEAADLIGRILYPPTG